MLHSIAVGGIEPIDILVGVVIGIGLLRGLFLGLVRESFSLAALGGAYISVVLFRDAAANWLQDASGGEIGPGYAPWLGAGLLAFATVLALVLIGKVLHRGIQAAGLGWADRVGGAVLGSVEGLIVVAIMVLLATGIVGREHPALANTRVLAMVEQLESLAAEPTADPDDVNVAAPPPRRR
jgi:membrane protein required for colicin V production